MNAREAITVLAIAAAIAIGGYVVGWYQQIFWYDMFAHAVSACAMTFTLGVRLHNGPGRTLGAAGATSTVVILTLMGLGAGAVWEIAE